MNLIDSNTLNTMTNNASTFRAGAGLGQATVGEITEAVIETGLGLLGAIFLVLMIVAGFNWMTAAGNETKVDKSLKMIKTAIIGLIIILAAYAITYFIFKSLPFSGSSSQVVGS